ncbi:MAG: ABC-F type ribosomal protection protein [Treponema sp.]|jgi:lincosamide and streptogramin A transport system ATP-binding/permease protein|nr:ABC-F type ribosomal protection protein [Treponema sp.]
MPHISIQNLTFAHNGTGETIFENVSLQIDTAWKLGLIGRNGRGKTTFLNLLLGKFEYSGKIAADANFEYFPYEVKNPDNAALDVARGIYPGIEQWQFERELGLLELDTHSLCIPFNRLSPGEQTKILLAILFLKPNTFLLIDEPTNHLDSKSRITVSRYLNRQTGFILVSHDRVVLDNCIDHVISINKAAVELQKGNFSSWQVNKNNRDNFERIENEKLHKEIKRLKNSARQTSAWADKTEKAKYGNGPVDKGFIGHKAAKLMRQAKNIESRQHKAVEEKSGLLKNIETVRDLKVIPLKYVKNKLIEARNLSIRYDDKVIFYGLNFSIENGDRAALIGKNGCGKSSLIKLIYGEKINYSGDFYRNTIKISYVPQSIFHLKGTVREYAGNLDVDEALFKSMLYRFGVQKDQFDKDVSDFSDGQKKKVLLAGSLCEQAHLYLWDEPLNFIDVLSHSQIEDLIINYNPTILFVEHDVSFIKNVATKKIIIERQ